MSNAIIAQVPHTALDWRIASESPSLDLETDLFTCTATDGQLIVAPTEAECSGARRRYEAIARSAGQAHGWGGARMWVADSIMGYQYFGATRTAAIRNAASENRAASERAYTDACNDRIAQVMEEDAALRRGNNERHI